MLLIDKNKCDPVLGHQIFDFLKEKGLLNHYKGSTVPDDQQNKIIDEALYKIFDTLGFNMEDPNFVDTPKRVRKYLRDTKAVMNWDYFPKIMTVPDQNGGCRNSSFIALTDLRFIGTCSHHLAPFFGAKPSGNGVVYGPGLSIAYIPTGKILGLSKFQSIVDFLCAVIPNTQETLTASIGWTISKIMETNDVAVYCNGYHSCMFARSAYSPAATTTLWVNPDGAFASDSNIRSEFLAIARQS